ncbi:MAG TPA: SIMPL domain-containing protein [Terriglobia bacterium]|nr:SIMPL domain-containing protein [Terriglobia bacterium]
MKKKTLFAILSMSLAGLQTAAAQDIQVSLANKTIELTVTQSVEAEAEVAVINVGYHNYAQTKESAFDESVRMANQITKSILDSGLERENLETQTLHLEPVEPEQAWTPELKAKRQFEADQSWDIHTPVSRAQALVDVAVRSGANEVESVEWDVRDPAALEAKATSSALARARALADQMVSGLGAKLGALIYASNTSRRPKGWPFMTTTLNTMSAQVGRKQPELKLFPKKVEKEATVHAIFAIQ